MFGAGAQMDAFEAAFRLPNILRRMFAEGAFSQAFVPIFAEYQRQRGEDADARPWSGSVGTLLAVVLLAVTIVGRARGALARLPAGGGLRADAGQGRADGADDPHRLPVPPVRVAGVARGRRAQRLPAVRDTRVHAGAAQRVDHRRRDVPRAARRPADPRARVGRVHRRRGAARAAAAPAGADRDAAAPRFDWRDEGVRRVLARWGRRCSASPQRRSRRSSTRSSRLRWATAGSRGSPMRTG